MIAETIIGIGLFMFIFGFAGVAWYDNAYTREAKISAAVVYISFVLLIIGLLGLFL